MNAVVAQTDLRDQFGPAREQGPTRPTCLAFAASDLHAAARAADWAELSCEYLYYHATRREGVGPGDGSKIKWTRESLKRDGQPLEAGWPYLKVFPADAAAWHPPAEVGALFRRAAKKLRGGFAKAWKTVTAGTPVLLGMSFTDAFLAAAGGVVDADEAVEMSRRHAVVAVATGLREGAKFLLVRNSWGKRWGSRGHAWLAEMYLKPRILEMVTIM